MTAIEIESGIPVPTGYSERQRYPFGDMKVGDSFAVSADNDAARLRRAAVAHGRYHNRKYTVRTLSTEIRCWRIA